MNILLDYFFPITAIEPTAQASTAFLKQVCVVATAKSGQEANIGTITLCTSMTAVAALTDNTDAQQLFNAGMSRVYILLAADLYLSEFLEGHESDFYTILISSDFDKDDITETKATGIITISSYANLVSGTDDVITVAGTTFTAQTGAAVLGAGTFQAATSNDATATSLAAQINGHATVGALVTATVLGAVVTLTAKGDGSEGNITLTYTDNDTNVGAVLSGLSAGHLANGDGLFLGSFTGVTGIAEDDLAFLATQAAIQNRCSFYSKAANGAKNMFYAFGKLLSNALTWRNQQYISLPVSDDVETLGDSESLFDDRISFAIEDDQYGNRLALFCCGGKAIFAPYVIKNLEIDMQSAALSYISGNQPAYTKVQAALLEDELQKVVADYIEDQLLEDGVVEVALEEDNFVASADINVAEPKALWRIFGEMRQTL